MTDQFRQKLLRESPHLKLISQRKAISQFFQYNGSPRKESQHFDYLSNWCNNLGQIVATKKDSKSISYVTINPEQKDYSLLQTGHGVLFVKTESAESYLDGYKIHLQIGNPSAVTYLGFKLEIAWGEMKTPTDYQDRTNNFTDALKAGFWTPIEVLITPATPASLRKAVVNIELNEAELRQSPSTP